MTTLLKTLDQIEPPLVSALSTISRAGPIEANNHFKSVCDPIADTVTNLIDDGMQKRDPLAGQLRKDFDDRWKDTGVTFHDFQGQIATVRALYLLAKEIALIRKIICGLGKIGDTDSSVNGAYLRPTSLKHDVGTATAPSWIPSMAQTWACDILNIPSNDIDVKKLVTSFRSLNVQAAVRNNSRQREEVRLGFFATKKIDHPSLPPRVETEQIAGQSVQINKSGAGIVEQRIEFLGWENWRNVSEILSQLLSSHSQECLSLGDLHANIPLKRA
ncbi:hypothetical protein HY285_03975 [Candidatus Peregrinibacteria bacterium]|nr:hypothetical protein [Candidatus Peregrinibacteria bacterium]MBI3816673.1 hypothetical protein [Candidatus Peregrinibacteria bacterium]